MGTSSNSSTFALVSMDNIGATHFLDSTIDESLPTVVELSVLASSCGKILRAVQMTRDEMVQRQLSGNQSTALAHSSEAMQKNANADDSNMISMKVSITSLGISLVADGNNKGSLFTDYRREMFSLYLEGIEVKHVEQTVLTKANQKRKNENGSRMFDGTTTSFSVRILDAQIDNYCASAVFPVLLMTSSEKKRKRAEKKAMREKKMVTTEARKLDDLNFFLLTAVKVLPRGSTSSIYEYIAMRMLSVQLAVDSGSLQLYLLDLHQDIVSSLGGTDGALAEEAPAEWVSAYNRRTVVPEAGLELVNVTRAKRAAQADKMYIEKLIIHPFKVTISYIHTNLPGDRHKDDGFMAPEFRWLKLVRDMAYLDNSSLTLKSFIVDGAMESPDSLVARLVETYVQSLLSQLVNIAGNIFGSLKIVGKPLDLVKNIGHGVKDLFYEPYQGAMESPEEFVRGLGSGAGSLFTHVIGKYNVISIVICFEYVYSHFSFCTRRRNDFNGCECDRGCDN